MAPSLLLPCPVSVDALGFRHRDCTNKLKFLLPSSSSFPSSGFSQRDRACTAIASKLKLRQERVRASNVCTVGLDSELPSEPIAGSPLVSPPSCSSSSSPSPNLTSERGILFFTGSSFFRAQSSLGRDLAVLAAALYKRGQGRLRVLDAMSGCGVRALRYLTQADADFVLANDCNPALHTTIVENLSRYVPLQGLHCPPEPFTRSSASGHPRKPCREDGFCRMEYANSVENSSSIENPRKTEILSSSSEAQQLLVGDASVECMGSIASEIGSATENLSRIDFSHPVEAKTLDYDRSPATAAATLRSSTSQYPVKTYIPVLWLNMEPS